MVKMEHKADKNTQKKYRICKLSVEDTNTVERLAKIRTVDKKAKNMAVLHVFS